MNDTLFLQRPQGRIGYDVTGPDAAALVVCVPGMGILRSEFRFTVPALVAAGYRVATMDLRGHGDSDATFDRVEDVATASDIVALVQQLGGPAVLLSHSMGVASSVIATADRPDLVSALVLCGPFVRDAPGGRLIKLAMRAALARPWGLLSWLAYYKTAYPGTKPADFAEQRAAMRASMKRPGYWVSFSKLTRQLTHQPAEVRLAEVAAAAKPTLAVVGSKDSDWKSPTAEGRFVADTLGGELLMVDGAGHYPMAQCPAIVNPAIVAFLSREVPVASA